MRSTRVLNQDILDFGRARYDQASGWDDLDRDDDGFVLLHPTAAHVDAKLGSLTTNIDSLEEKLRKYRAEKAKTIQITKTDEYRESKKQAGKKKKKKQRETLLQMVFNAADDVDEDEEESDDDGSGYKDKKKGGGRSKKNTLDTTYGQRFSPVVSMLYDTIQEFDAIAADIDSDLKASKNTSKTMYRASQIGNLISAKNSKLSAVKELASVATTLSKLEYQRDHEKRAAEGDVSKEVASVAAKYLRGGFDISGGSKKKGKKKDDKDAGKSKRSSKRIDDDDDDPYGKIERADKGDVSPEDQKALAGEFAKALMKRKDEMHFTPWEKNIQIEGTYHVMVLVDPLDQDDWSFVAVDNETGKIIKDFKEKYKGVLPKKSKCRAVFDFTKMRMTDKNSNKMYKLMTK